MNDSIYLFTTFLIITRSSAKIKDSRFSSVNHNNSQLGLIDVITRGVFVFFPNTYQPFNFFGVFSSANLKPMRTNAISYRLK